MKENKFLQGYACCLANIILSHGCNTAEREAFSAGFGNVPYQDLLNAGIETHDLNVFIDNNLLKS